MTWRRWASVSLFVRLWVEKHSNLQRLTQYRVSLFVRLWVENLFRCSKWMNWTRQPLREAVSWKTDGVQIILNLVNVSLFVRLWVEKQSPDRAPIGARSASSWGCELKTDCRGTDTQYNQSASSWGCELKTFRSPVYSSVAFRQPLREAVSWKQLHSPCPELLAPSASSWGCELKIWWKLWRWIPPGSSASSWGCELKMVSAAGSSTVSCVSLFVRLWVEKPVEPLQHFLRLVSLFVRLWVEKFSYQIIKYYRDVSLFVRLWVEKLKFYGNKMVTFVSLFVRLWVEKSEHKQNPW